MHPTSAGSAVPNVRLIHLSMPLGVLLFLGVALFVRASEPAPAGASPLPMIALAAGAPALLLALLLRSRLPSRASSTPEPAWWEANLGRVMVIWAMLEGAALLGVVAYFITGETPPLAVTAAALVLFAMVAPGRLANS